MQSTSHCSRAGQHQSGFPTLRHRRVSEPDGVVDDLPLRYAAGDADALAALYARYAGPMLTAALHLLGRDRRLAEEAVQVAMVKAWRATSTYDPTRPLAPWLFSILRRCAIDIWRKERRHRLPPLDSPAGESAASTGDGVESAASAWAVREALGTLTADEHAVMRFSHFEGLTHIEIAERLDVPVGTVKSRAARAYRRLRAELGSAPVLAR
jgi:RNA polymerase sigma-70 factor, ECF subfamily